MGRFFGTLLIAAAIVCLVFVIALEPREEDDSHEDNFDLGPRNGNGDDHTQGYNLYVQQNSDIQLNFDSNGNVRVIHVNQRTGNENEIERNATSGYYHFHTDDDGDHEIRFENRENSRTNVHFSITNTYMSDEGPRPFCGVLSIVFLILGVVFMKRKGKNKGPVVIHASETEFAAATSMEDVQGTEGARPPPGAMGAEFGPPSQHSTNLSSHAVPGLTSPDGTSNLRPGAPSTSKATTATAMDISTDATRDKPFPMPTMEDRIGHEFRFPCPDCGTVIFINRKIKKVTCPKCSHTFKIKQE
jgi:hypothetical protein